VLVVIGVRVRLGPPALWTVSVVGVVECVQVHQLLCFLLVV
jgi:hypothetical protein